MKKHEKTPVVLQMEAAECGAASLGIILGYYKKYMPLEKLRELCGVSRNGSNAGNVMSAAETLGMKAEGFSYAPEELKKLIPPFIIHWEFHHFLVFEGYDEKSGEVFLNDPAVGHRSVSWEEFEGSFTGVTLVLRPGDGFVQDGEQESIWKTLLSDIVEDRRALCFILGVGLCLSLVNLGVPLISQTFLDDVLTYKHRQWLFDVLLALFIALVMTLGLNFLRSWCLIRWQGQMTISESSSFLAYVLKLPVAFFHTRYSGEIASRVQFHESIADFVTGKLAMTVLDIGIAVFYLFLLTLYNVKLTVIGVIFTAISIFVTYASYQWLKEQRMKLQQEYGNLYGISVAGIASVETLKANGNEEDFFVKWADANARYLTMAQKQEYYSQFINFVPAALSGMNGAIIMAEGGFSIMDGLMSVGIFVAFQSLMQNFQAPIGRITGMSQDIQQASSQMMKINDVYRYPLDEEKELTEEAMKGLPPKLSGRLELKQVNFGYSHTLPTLIKKLNLKLEPGRRVAIVGKSGSGKSTLAKLVSGLYQPWSGEILFDGVPSTEVPREVFAQSVAVVEQDIFLLEGTVAENISLFDPNVPIRDIIQAAKDAMIHDEIALMRGGYDAMLEEGGFNLSGGQRQRMEIARALAANPSLLILDEATSALDPVTEREIMKNIRRRGCACFIVAHRLSTIRDCDEIIVLKKGRVVQRGTHESLMEEEGYYKKLIQSY
ncbi:MAG: NHLP family bacteriocin export ABC transporter peptidase/permease/ATPase subunit [Schwartzia sp.]|nr:NHLP family bacteriocin export ABC transporter peptidase/permease/ATPase subunit [Schwartzia sp. (in: firmicutes)]